MHTNTGIPWKWLCDDEDNPDSRFRHVFKNSSKHLMWKRDGLVLFVCYFYLAKDMFGMGGMLQCIHNAIYVYSSLSGVDNLLKHTILEEECDSISGFLRIHWDANKNLRWGVFWADRIRKKFKIIHEIIFQLIKLIAVSFFQIWITFSRHVVPVN